MTYFTAREKYDEAVRECRLRVRVYERLVNVGTKSKESAKRQLDIMAEIANDYRQLAKQENLLNEDLIPPTRAKKDRQHTRPPRDAGLDRDRLPAPEGRVEASPAQADQGRAGGGSAGLPSDVPPDANRTHGESTSAQESAQVTNDSDRTSPDNPGGSR